MQSEAKIQQDAFTEINLHISCIYKIESPDGKVYIGQATDFSVRLYKYRRGLLDGQFLIKQSIEKFGFNAHRIEIVHKCKPEDLNHWERHYQDLYDVCGPNGLNCVLTGTSEMPYYCRPETRERISKANKGKVVSDQCREKMSKAQKNRHRSPEEMEYLSKRWISIMKSRTGIPLSDETKAKLRAANLGTKCEKRQGFNHPHSKIVVNIETGVFYGSAKHAAEAHGINYATLKDRLSERRGRVNNSSLIYV